MADLPTKPPDIDKLDELGAIEAPGGAKQPTPEPGKFASFMKEEPQTSQQLTPDSKVSPMQLGEQGKIPSKPPTLEEVKSQINTVSSSLGDVQSQLQTKGLKLKQSQKYLLRNKLTSANEQIRQAAKKVGVDTGAPPDLSGKKSPITKFLSLVADGQHQLNSATQEVQRLASSNKGLNPGDFLLIQVKLQKAQQELDYSSVLLGKAVDMVKQLFNVQI